jgi:dienelactone hydrolase
MKERFVDVATPDVPMDTFVTHPEEGGPFPAVVVTRRRMRFHPA